MSLVALRPLRTQLRLADLRFGGTGELGQSGGEISSFGGVVSVVQHWSTLGFSVVICSLCLFWGAVDVLKSGSSGSLLFWLVKYLFVGRFGSAR